MRLYFFTYLQISEATSAEQFNELVLNNTDFIISCGYTKPPILSDKTEMITVIMLHKVIMEPLGELIQFKEGLSTLGVLNALKSNATELKNYFCCNQNNALTAGTHPLCLTLLATLLVYIYRHNS